MGVGQRMEQRRDAGFAGEGKAAGGPLFFQPRQGLAVGRLMTALGRVDVAQEGAAGIGTKTGIDGARFNQADMYPATRQFEAQSVAITFQCKFAGVIGAAILHGNQPQYRAVLHYPTLFGLQHRRQHLTDQMVPAKQVGIELLPERFGRQIFQRPGLAVSSMSDVAVNTNTEHHVADKTSALNLLLFPLELC